MLPQIISSYLAILAFSAYQEVPKKYIFFSAFTGAVAWTSYLIILQQDHSKMAAAFLSTALMAVLSHILARVIKAPVTVFLIPGLLPVVPGGSIYKSVYYLIQSNQDLSTHYLVETLQITGAMTLAVFIVDSLFPAIIKNKSICGCRKGDAENRKC